MNKKAIIHVKTFIPQKEKPVNYYMTNLLGNTEVLLSAYTATAEPQW